mgnify:CR=1 FL=1
MSVGSPFTPVAALELLAALERENVRPVLFEQPTHRHDLEGLRFVWREKIILSAMTLDLLADVPQSRMFDEMLKLLQTGHALASIEQLKGLGVARGIYPLLDLVVERAADPFVSAALHDTDRRVGEDKPVAPSFLLACVLWSDVRQAWQQERQHQAPVPALQSAIDQVFDARIGDVSGRGKLAADMREIWMMQPRFDKRAGHGPMSLVTMARFRAGFDFMRLRADVGEVDEALADWWQTFSLADEPEPWPLEWCCVPRNVSPWAKSMLFWPAEKTNEVRPDTRTCVPAARFTIVPRGRVSISKLRRFRVMVCAPDTNGVRRPSGTSQRRFSLELSERWSSNL